MKAIKSCSYLLAFCAWMGPLTADTNLYAQEVPHHDFVVDNNDPGECLSCHDGAVASNIFPCTENCLLDRSASHSVFKKYPPAGRETEFAPLAQLEANGIRLTNGEVTCISCHNLTNQRPLHLVMEDQRQLCVTCHIR